MMTRQPKNRYSFFMSSLVSGFVSIFMPWSFAAITVHQFDTKLGYIMSHPFTFWRSSLFALVFKDTPCRDWVVANPNTAADKTQSLIQIAGFVFVIIVIALWTTFLWVNRNESPSKATAQILVLGVALFLFGSTLVWRLFTNTTCISIQSLELENVDFVWGVMLLPIMSLWHGISAVVMSLRKIRD